MDNFRYFAILLPLFASIVTVVGQLLYKHSASIKKSGASGTRWLSFFIMGNLSFFFAIVFNFIAMKFVPLFIVYSFTALNYVFITIASGLILKEKIKKNNVLASIMIAAGVFIISLKY